MDTHKMSKNADRLFARIAELTHLDGSDIDDIDKNILLEYDRMN